MKAIVSGAFVGLCLVVGVILAGQSATSLLAGETHLYINSPYGEPTGRGQEYFFDGSSAGFSGRFWAFNVAEVDVAGWRLVFTAPDGLPLTKGTYVGAQGWATRHGEAPGLTVDSPFSGCGGTLTGSFTIKEVVPGTNDVIESFWATFVQQCGISSAALTGEIMLNAHPPVVVRAPRTATVTRDQLLGFTVSAASTSGAPVALTASNLPPGASFTDNGDNTASLSWTPSYDQIGNYRVWFRGENGLGESRDERIDFSVGPLTKVTSFTLDAKDAYTYAANDPPQVFAPPDAMISCFTTPDHGVHVGTPAPGSISYYSFIAPEDAHLTRADYTNGFDVGTAPVCDLLDTGHFHVKQVAYGVSNDVVAFWCTFEQSCYQLYKTIFGEIKYNADVIVGLQAPFHQTVVAGQTLTFDVSATEANANLVELTASDLPSGASFQDNHDNTGTFIWVTTTNQVDAVVLVRFRAENGSAISDDAATQITVARSVASTYFVDKSQLCLQKNSKAPKRLKKHKQSPFALSAGISPATNTTLGYGVVVSPNGTTNGIHFYLDGTSDGLNQFFRKQDELEAAFPAGTYRLTAAALDARTQTHEITMPPTDLPSLPHLSSWLAAQAVNPGRDLGVVWDPFIGGGTNDLVQLEIFDASTNLVYTTPDAGEQGALNGLCSAITIPAYTLLPGQAYAGILKFRRTAATEHESFPPTLVTIGFSSIAGFEINTISDLRAGTGSVKFSSKTYAVRDDVGFATISVVRSGGNSVPISVDYATSGGTARAGTDYSSVSGSLVFESGVTSGTFTILVASGCASNGPKTVGLLLGKPGGGRLGARKATLSIQAGVER